MGSYLREYNRRLGDCTTEKQIKFENFVIKAFITNRVTNVRLHSLSKIFKRGTKVRVDVPAPQHNVIPENNNLRHHDYYVLISYRI